MRRYPIATMSLLEALEWLFCALWEARRKLAHGRQVGHASVACLGQVVRIDASKISGSPVCASAACGRAGASASVGGGCRGLVLQGGSDGAGEFCAPDEQERDRDGGQCGEPGDPERPLEPAGERGGRGVALD